MFLNIFEKSITTVKLNWNEILGVEMKERNAGFTI